MNDSANLLTLPRIRFETLKKLQRNCTAKKTTEKQKTKKMDGRITLEGGEKKQAWGKKYNLGGEKEKVRIMHVGLYLPTYLSISPSPLSLPMGMECKEMQGNEETRSLLTNLVLGSGLLTRPVLSYPVLSYPMVTAQRHISTVHLFLRHHYVPSYSNRFCFSHVPFCPGLFMQLRRNYFFLGGRN